MDTIVITESAKKERKSLRRRGISDIYCVYGHQCKVTGKWYVGVSYHVDNLEMRFGTNGSKYLKTRYISSTKTTKYNHPKFANAINKYGWDNFTHEVLGYYTEDIIDEMECYWIGKKDALDNGYNSTSGGLGGHKLTEENIKELSVPVIMYDLKTGRILKRFESEKDAAKYVGVKSSSRIGTCCRGLESSCHGYGFKYADRSKKRIYHTSATKNICNHTNGYNKKVSVDKIDIDTGKILATYNSLSDASKTENIPLCSISKCCSHKRNTAGGFKWEFRR